MKVKTRMFLVVLLISLLLMGSLIVKPAYAENAHFPYLSLSGTMDFVTNTVSISGQCDKNAVVLVNGKVFDLPNSGKFYTDIKIKEENSFVIATPNGKSIRVVLKFPQMPRALIKALPKLNFSFNTSDLVLHYGGQMVHKPAGRVSGYVINESNGKKTSFVVNSDKSFQSDIQLTSGRNVIHSYARYLYFIKFSVPDFTVDFSHAKVLKLKINSPYMYIDGVKKEVDPGRGTTPVILKGWNRTLLPIRAVAEGLGGEVGWNGKERKVTLSLGYNNVALWIGNPVAEVNGEKVYIDPNNHKVKPIIINDRTMLPVRFVAESLGAYVKWYGETREVLVVYPKE